MKKTLSRNELNSSIAVLVGTRPGIIKFSPVIRELQQRQYPFFIIHTGQHYSYNMDRQFFEDLNLTQPRYHNDVVSKETLHGAQTAHMIIEVEKALLDAKPGMLIVGGDANTNLSGALAARKLGIPLAHMEAGLRSNDWSMPEEHNRIMIDHISEILFSPTEKTRKNLVEDNIKGDIYIVGNSIVDAVYQNRKIAAEKSDVLARYKLEASKYILVTVHREENLDRDEPLRNILDSLEAIASRSAEPVIFPIHPRTEKRLAAVGAAERIHNIPNLKIIEPLGYIDFLALLSQCRIVLTDSGGIQEESCVMRIPCVTLRDNTERPETVDVGANIVAGTKSTDVLAAVDEMLKRPPTWDNPFGDGRTAEYIVDKMIEFVKQGTAKE